MHKRIGLIVNPIAGMGGSVGLKGTDGDMRSKAIDLGAEPVAPARTAEFLSHVRHRDDIRLLVAPGPMGRDFVSGFDQVATVGSVGPTTSAQDTRCIAAEMVARGVDLLVFVGGDGTARDVCDAVDLRLPVIGVPAGVKVYSAVFATSARAAGALLDAYIDGAEVIEEEVLDIDEEAFRRGILDAKLYGYLLVPKAVRFLQAGKEAAGTGTSTRENQQEIGEYVADEMSADTLYLLGPGTTVKAITDALGLGKTLLGVDAVCDRRTVGTDLNEREILAVLERYRHRKLIVTPLGGNGFIFGRGNRQFTPAVIRRIGTDNLQVVATRDKLGKLPCLRVDTGDFDLDQTLAGHIDVIVGNRYSKVVRVEC